MYDVCILGSGLAGLTAAAYLPKEYRVLIVSQGPESGNSWLAQGGVAAALSPDDDSVHHFVDTVRAGHGHVNEHHAKQLVEQGVEVVKEFLDKGFPTTRTETGEIDLGREAAHSHSRIVHAGGDQTGRFWMQHLSQITSSIEKMQVQTIHSLILEDDRCIGVRVCTTQQEIMEIYAASTILALGGVGGLFEVSSNSPAAIGTGLSLAYHAGALLEDLEFIQFHPTIAYSGSTPLGLVTEAVRGAGAYFSDANGKQLPIDPLAPRDQVARSVERYWQAGMAVYLDLSPITDVEHRFPTVWQTMQRVGSKNSRLAVRPGAHFHMGGIRTDLSGRSTIPGLFAIGENACTGVHGANRLASNSLLECLVMGKNVANAVDNSPSIRKTTQLIKPGLHTFTCDRKAIQKLLTQHVGVLRDSTLDQLVFDYPIQPLDLTSYNMNSVDQIHTYTTAALMLHAAAARHESRGAHFRVDHPQTSSSWDKYTITFEKDQMKHGKRQTNLNHEGVFV